MLYKIEIHEKQRIIYEDEYEASNPQQVINYISPNLQKTFQGEIYLMNKRGEFWHYLINNKTRDIILVGRNKNLPFNSTTIKMVMYNNTSIKEAIIEEKNLGGIK